MAVAYTEETASRASAWLAASGSKRRTNEYVAELHALYALITGQPASGCVSCGFAQYVEVLTAYVRHFQRLSDPTLMADSQYAFAPGFESETFSHDSYGKAVTAENITDEDAAFILTVYPHLLVKKAAAKAAKTEAPAKPLTEKQQLQAAYTELHGEAPDDKLTIAQLNEANAAKQAELDQQD